MIIKTDNFDYDLEWGFVWFKAHGYTFQACLDGDKFNNSDCGYNWGICGDVNEYLIEKYGADSCLKTLALLVESCNELEIIE